MKKESHTLCMVLESDRILLGMKKRGFGADKWNGFGGKVHDNESVEEAARRELMEEAQIDVQSLEKIGHITFIYDDHHVSAHVFVGEGIVGVPTETEEMRPQWFSHADIPYATMWEDDSQWVPLMLAGKKFVAQFVFDANNVLCDSTLREVNDPKELSTIE